MPNFSTTTARIKVEAAADIFFDRSNTNFTIQSATGVAGDVPFAGHPALAAAKRAGASPAGLAAALDFQRKAQWGIDFVNAENSMGFHAPQEAARTPGEAIDYCRQGQSALRQLALAPGDAGRR